MVRAIVTTARLLRGGALGRDGGEPSLGADLRRAALVREVWRVAWPAIVHMLLLTAVFVASRVIVGRSSARSLAALQLGSTVVWTFYSLFSALAAATLAVVSRSVGARDEVAAAACARGAIGAALGLGLVVAAPVVLFAGPMLAALFPSTEPDVLRGGATFLRLAGAALPLAFVEATSAAALQARGDTRTPLLVAGLGNLVNLAVTTTLVFGLAGAPTLGVSGAALGAAATMTLEGLLLGGIVLRRTKLEAARASLGEHVRELRRVLTVAGPAFGEKAIYHVGYTAFVAILATLGSSALAANQALVSIEAISFLSADGFGVAAAAIVGQKLGAARAEEASQAGWIAAAMSTAALSLMGLAFALFPRVFMRPFTSDLALIELGARALLVAAVAQPFMGCATVLQMALRGAGDTKTVLVGTLVGGLVVRVSATYLFAVELGLGLSGVWLGSTVDWAVRTVFFGARFADARWRKTIV